MRKLPRGRGMLPRLKLLQLQELLLLPPPLQLMGMETTTVLATSTLRLPRWHLARALLVLRRLAMLS